MLKETERVSEMLLVEKFSSRSLFRSIIAVATMMMLAALLLLVASSGNDASAAEYGQYLYKIDYFGGGDCELIGAWDQYNHTCTLNTDINVPASIDGKPAIGIAIEGFARLNGNGHTIDGENSGEGGISFNAFEGVYIEVRPLPFPFGNPEVENLTVTNFYNGIHVQGSAIDPPYSAAHIRNNTIINTATGIIGNMTTGTVIEGNTINGNGTGIICNLCWFSTIEGNSVSSSLSAIDLDFGNNLYVIANELIGNVQGIDVHIEGFFDIRNNIIDANDSGVIVDLIWYYGCQDPGSDPSSVITGNTLSNNSVVGLSIVDHACTAVYHNNFIDNGIQATEEDDHIKAINSFDGNYWSDFDTIPEGCRNDNLDAFCDSPYYFDNNQDNYPFTSPSGWIVFGPTNQPHDLLRYFEDVNPRSRIRGPIQGMVSQLNSAQMSLDQGHTGAAINQMGAFINEVEAQSGKSLTEENAGTIISGASMVIMAMGR